MKRPYYYLINEVVHRPDQNQEIVFRSGSLVTPILDHRYLPEHLKREIDAINVFNSDDEYVMCLLGIFWIPVKLSNIKEVI